MQARCDSHPCRNLTVDDHMTAPEKAASCHGATVRPKGVTDDCPCRTCGYNLRTLPLDGRCPECGASVTASRGTQTLLAAPRHHLLQLLIGAVLVMVAAAAFGVAMVALAVVASSGVRPFPITPLVAASVAGAILFCSATGLVLLTRRDPRLLVDPACTSLQLAMLAAFGAGVAAISALPPDTKSSGQALVLLPAAAILLILLFLLPAQVVGRVAQLLTQLALPRAARSVEWLYPGHPFLLLLLLTTATIAARHDAVAEWPWLVLATWAGVWLSAFRRLCGALWHALQKAQ